MADDSLMFSVLSGAPKLSKAEFRITEGQLNDQRLLQALHDAINGKDLIEPEQAKIDQGIRENEDKRSALIAADAPPDEIEAVEIEILEAKYYRWLVEQKLVRASEEAQRRLAYWEALDSPEKQEAEIAKCKDGLQGRIHWWHHWAWTSDPRTDAPLTYIPFLPFDCQDELIGWIYNLVYTQRKDGHLDKSRDLGASWIVMVFGAMEWLLAPERQPFTATYGSRKEAFVDKVGDSDTLLEKGRIALRLVPGWMLPKGFTFAKHAPFLNIKNPVTGSLLKGESANEQFARGGRQAMVVFDESAAWPSGGYAAWTAASESTRTRLAVSTPQGKFNKFGELKTDKNIPHFSLHWRQHPWKTEDSYRIASRRLSAVELAQEWDLDYEGSVAGRLLWMFSEPHHVITQSEFIKVFGQTAIGDDGQFRIPKGWRHTVAMDCGTSDDHPTVLIAAAMAPANSVLPRHLFFHVQIFMGEGAQPLIMAPIIKDTLKKYIKDDDIENWLISHEAESERLIYQDHFGLPFRKWDTEAGYTMGYPQTQAYFTPYAGKHPFRPELHGHPRAFIIVEDKQGELMPVVDGFPLEYPEMVQSNVASLIERKEQITRLISATKSRWTVKPAMNDVSGFKRTREELPRVHIPQSEEGKPVKAQRHFKKFDDAFDVVRAICAALPSMVALTDEERLQQRLQKSFKDGQALETMKEEGYTAYYAYQEARHEIAEDIREERYTGRESYSGRTVRTIRDR